MICSRCGTPIAEGVNFCPNCGQPVEDGNAIANGELTRQVSDDLDFGADMSEHIPLTMGSTPASGTGPHTGTRYASGSTGGSMGSGIGSTFVTPDYQQPSPQPPRNRGLVVALVAFAVTVLIGAIAFFVLPAILDGDKDSDKEETTVEEVVDDQEEKKDEEEKQEPQTFKLTFETSGGSTVSAITAEEGEVVTSPADPKRDGYTFAGWYSDSDHSDKVSFPLTVEKDMMFYAKWDEVKKEEPAQADQAQQQQQTQQQAPAPQQVSNSSSGYNYASLTVVGADGTSRTETIRRQPGTEFVLLDGNGRYYSESEVAALSDAERCVAWNEIIAASNGYVFKNGGLRSYFNNCSWYYPVSGAGSGGNLTAAGSYNVELLQAYTSSWWKNLAAY